MNSNFFNFIFFLIFAKKNLKKNVEKHLLEKKSFETHSRNNLPYEAISKNFKAFLKKSNSFSEKLKFWMFWEISLFQSHSTANLL